MSLLVHILANTILIFRWEPPKHCAPSTESQLGAVSLQSKMKTIEKDTAMKENLKKKTIHHCKPFHRIIGNSL